MRNDVKIPRALVVQDLSCMGRCALTVAIPALSSLGVQAVPLPTAVLSTHTGGFGIPAVCDLTGFMERAVDHYRQLDLHFDAVISGYLANLEQARQVEELLIWQKDALHVVDPVMGDGGKMYRSLPRELPERFLRLGEKADLFTPNWTEACLLTGEQYDEEPVEESRLLSVCRQLPGRAVVITGVHTAQGRANAIFERETKCLTLCPYQNIPAHYPGTGDLFASLLSGHMLRGETLKRSVERTAEYICRVIERTRCAGTPAREGVLLEGCPEEEQ